MLYHVLFKECSGRSLAKLIYKIKYSKQTNKKKKTLDNVLLFSKVWMLFMTSYDHIWSYDCLAFINLYIIHINTQIVSVNIYGPGFGVVQFCAKASNSKPVNPLSR